MDDPFISTIDLGYYLRADLTDDNMAVIATNAACQLVRDYTNQQINGLADDEMALDGTGKRTMLLPQLPVVSVSAVSLLNSWDNSTDLLDTTRYAVTRSGILSMVADEVWPRGRANVLVKHDHGYATLEADEDVTFPGVPDSMRLVALEQAAAIYSAGTLGTGGVTGETMGAYSYTVDASAITSAAALTDPQRRTLGRYRVAQ